MLFQAPVHAENAHVIGKKGTTPYVTHFIFRPLQSLEIPGVGTAHLLEAVGTTQNLKGEPMLDKMAARCTALNVESGDKKYIDGACALTDKDGTEAILASELTSTRAWRSCLGPGPAFPQRSPPRL